MSKKTLIALLILLALLVAGSAVAVWVYLNPRAAVEKAAEFALKGAVNKPEAAVALMPVLMGAERPRTIMFLFMNNTELRPGGGFIGSYGIVKTDRGAIASVETFATENLDYEAPETFKVEPPMPIKRYLIAHWYFRDTNWSPDFNVNARRALRFYSAEGGVDADKIETVIGITPTVIERLLAYTGPLQAQGKTYTAQNITDLLEYTVEIEFTQKGIHQSKRKEVISELAAQLTSKLKQVPPTKWGPMLEDTFALMREGQIVMYDVNPDVQKTIDELGWGGRVMQARVDKLMVVDANLAALKTDRVIDREVEYTIFKDAASGEWRARVVSTYKHGGGFDWKTTRYGTYTRWYFPQGTRFISGSGSQIDYKRADPAPWDVVEDVGHTSIGTFLVVEPRRDKQVTLEIALAPQVAAAIAQGDYELHFQKQLGVEKIKLTVRHDFGTSVLRADPPPTRTDSSDNVYFWTGDLTQDTTLRVSF